MPWFMAGLIPRRPTVDRPRSARWRSTASCGPVCYQDLPDALLPAELRGEGETAVPRPGRWRLDCRQSLMPLRLVQLRDTNGERIVAALRDDSRATRVNVQSTRDLALMAIAEGRSLAQQADHLATETVIDIAAAEAEGRLLAPIDHPDAAHCHLTGTGLTHLGSAEGRDKMHKAAAGNQMTDSMRMFQMGLGRRQACRRCQWLPARMVLQRGRKRDDRHRPSASIAGFRARRERGAGNRGHLCDRR